MDDNRVTYFAETDARNKRVKFGIKSIDRTKHVYVIGKTGMGKSTLLENIAVQDIQNGAGMAFIDPHGKTADLLLEYVPKERIRDVIVIAPFDTDFPISFNVLESVDPKKRHLVVGGLMSTFKKIWEDAWSARMEYILTNTLLALLEVPNTTLLSVNRMLSDKAYRNEIVAQVQDPSVKAFWVKEFANYTERMAAEAVPAIQNKVGQFTANPLIRNMIGQPVSSFDFRKAMDENKIIIINLSKGRIGDENMKLLGGLLVTKIYLAAMSRADVPDRVVKMLPHFYLFVDEFQNFANASFSDILSESRKYKLNLTIAHQYIEQMDENVSAAVFGNVGTMIVFRVGATDAEALEKEFAPQFTMEDLVNLGQFQMYLKLMINGLTSAPFSATSMGPIPQGKVSYVKEIIDASREQFARPREVVEEIIAKFHEPTPAPKKEPSATKAPLTGDLRKPEQKIVAQSMPATTPKVSVEVKPMSVQTPKPEQKPISSEIKPVVKTDAPAKFVPPVRATAPSPLLKDTLAKLAAQPRPAPVVKMVAPIVQKSDTASVPTAHQPFKKAFATVAPAQSTSIPNPVQINTQVPAVKPVSLSSLQKPNLVSPVSPASPRLDPKAQTPQNVSQLKNALAAALARSKPVDVTQAVPQPVSAEVNAPVSAPVPVRPQIEEQKSQTEHPHEVSEEVLKKVLKID
ncbi:MAG: type IV secretion system DNA-binding domain-containing protein [Candidatus Pacebacteria bacterium]|nr:type IV secretion system DNA-binding domain-containing protein [Candidatus Paceibacterota bacterium]